MCNLKVCMVAHSIEVCVCVLPWLSLCDRLGWGGGISCWEGARRIKYLTLGEVNICRFNVILLSFPTGSRSAAPWRQWPHRTG